MKGLIKISATLSRPSMEYYSDLGITPDPEFVGYNTRMHPAFRNPNKLGPIGSSLYKMLYKKDVMDAVIEAERTRKMQERNF